MRSWDDYLRGLPPEIRVLILASIGLLLLSDWLKYYTAENVKTKP